MVTIKLKNASIRRGKISIKKSKPTQFTDKYNFQLMAEGKGLIVTPEYRFSTQRQFKSDWCVSNKIKTCLVEYEGISNEGKSGHTTLVGYTSNCEKYNLAQLLGYPVFRYTKLNFDQVWDDLKNFFTDNYGK